MYLDAVSNTSINTNINGSAKTCESIEKKTRF